jgi:hypothetical protein
VTEQLTVAARTSTAAPRRSWLRFSLRTLLIALTVFGVWLGLRVNAARRQQQAVEAVAQLGGWVRYDFEAVDGKHNRVPGATSWVPAWLLERTGPDLFHDVVEVNMVYSSHQGRQDNAQGNDAIKDHLHAFPRLEWLLLKEGQASDKCLAAVGRLPRLKRLYCWDARLATDAGVAHLGKLQNLEYIHISESNLTDKSLGTFGQLRKLEGLSLQGNAFTDAGLAHLQGLDKLTDLWVNMGKSHMSDAGLSELSGLSSLEVLAIQGDITEEAVLELQRKLPNLKTVYR